MILLRGLAQYMRRQGILAWSPPPHAATPRYLPHIFTPAELAALFAAIDACSVDPRSPYRHWIFPVLFRLLYGTGIRISEALALTYHDFDSKAGMIHIRHGKGDKERRIPIHETLVARLEDYVAKLPSQDPDVHYFLIHTAKRTRPALYMEPSVVFYGPLVFRTAGEARDPGSMMSGTPLRSIVCKAGFARARTSP